MVYIEVNSFVPGDADSSSTKVSGDWVGVIALPAVKDSFCILLCCFYSIVCKRQSVCIGANTQPVSVHVRTHVIDIVFRLYQQPVMKRRQQ